MSLCSALSSWLRTAFPGVWQSQAGQSIQVQQVATVLNQIDVNHFTSEWKASIRASSSEGGNSRLTVFQLKKILTSIRDYHQYVLGQGLEQAPMPDCAKVAEGDEAEKGRFLQLILGCAVNCENKQQYIESIMQLEETEQTVIMTAIQELMNLQADAAAGEDDDANKIYQELSEAKADKEALLQRCHDMENEINLLKDEKANLLSECDRLTAIGGVSAPTRRSDSHDHLQQIELKKQVESLTENLFKMETQRDDATAKLDLLERQLDAAQAKEVELQKLADQALKLKDEVDILRENADKVAKYEATLESYKKKLEDLGDLKRQVKLLEEKNTEYMHKIVELEEGMKKTGNWRPQVDAYKKQIAELHAKLEAETKKGDKLDFEVKKLLEKAEALSEERDRLQAEREELKTRNDELHDEIKFGQVSKRAAGSTDQLEGEPDSGTLEMIPSSVKERLLRLQVENKNMKAALTANQGGNAELLQTMVDDLKDRETELQASNRKANQRIIELESKLEESGGAGASAAPRIPGSREELELRLAEANRKNSSLEETLTKRDQEIHSMEERYKKYIEKAKSVIRTLEPKQNAHGGTGQAPEISALKNQITEKDRVIEAMEQETEKVRAVREMEERLLSSAFHNLSMQLHRNAVEQRLASATGSHGVTGSGQAASHAQGQSFLARQRQVSNNRKAGGGGGYNSSEYLDY